MGTQRLEAANCGQAHRIVNFFSVPAAKHDQEPGMRGADAWGRGSTGDAAEQGGGHAHHECTHP